VTRYILRRLLGSGFLLLGVATLIFVVLHLAPGDPLSQYMSPNMTPEVLAALREFHGFDDPIFMQYFRWMRNALTGEFGVSIPYGRPVRDVILELAPNTLRLTGTALLASALFGSLIGVLQAVRHHSFIDRSLSAATLFFYSMPSFWLALMLSMVFSLYAGSVWGWPISFPVAGMNSAGYEALSGWGRFLDSLAHLFLPALTLVLILGAGFARFMRASMLEVLGQDYIRTARAKGLPEHRVVFGHALRNGLLPVITLFGLAFPLLLGGAVFVETIFGWPGMGRLMVRSIQLSDIPMVMATSFVFAVTVVAGNLLADIGYAVADPRIRHEDA